MFKDSSVPKDISEDEVSQCISEKVEDGVPQDQAVAICLSEAESGSAQPENRAIKINRNKKDVLTQTVLVPDQLLYSNESTAELVAEMLGLEGTHEHELGDSVFYMPGESHDSFFEVLGEPGVQDLVDDNMENDTAYGDDEEQEDSKSLEDPQYTVGDYLRWDFATGSAEGEVIERATDPGDQLSAGGNTFTIDEEGGERDVPLYKLQEYDDQEEEFTNNVVKFEDQLREVQRPDDAPATAPRNRSKSKATKKRHNFRVKGSKLELTKQEDGEALVNVPIQAVSEDRDGDIITDKGQESILRQLQSGEVPLVPNHGVGSGSATYDFRDIFGQFTGGEMIDGTTVGKARLRKGSKMADELQDLLEQDMPVGFSVGFIPTETEERGEGGMLVNDLDLMEISAVGVPSNPDAVPQAMSGAVAAAKSAGMDKKQIISKIEKAFDNTMDPQKQTKTESEGLNLKQMTEDDVPDVVSMVNETVSTRMEEAIEDLESQLSEMASAHSDEMDEDMDEDAQHGDEEEEDSLSDDEKTVSSQESSRKIQGVDDSSVQEDSALYDEPEGSGWGTTT